MPDRREDRDAWNAVAAFWHDRMGEGNDFVNVLIWPAVRRLLQPLDGVRIVDVGCGNGLYARRLAGEGAQVHAIDYSSRMIAHARAATRDHRIEYEVLDAADGDELARLPTVGYDAALATMVLMDMVDVAPLYRALARILVPGGRFVFATAHPSFNSPHAHLEAESEGGRAGAAVRVQAYRTPSRTHDIAIRGQPVRTLFFHRSISDLLRPAFAAGLVLDALEEACFPADHEGSRPESWGGRFHEFPAVLIGRLRNASPNVDRPDHFRGWSEA